jgi:hypothetical protein
LHPTNLLMLLMLMLSLLQGFKWSRAAHMAPFFSLEGRPERPLSVRIKGKLVSQQTAKRKTR